MKFKGISPLIAAVLLIAFTMAIAGIMAIWATTFSQQRLQTAATCPALTVQDLSYSTTTGDVTLRLLNTNRNAPQTGIKVSVLYPDGVNSEGNALANLAALAVRTDTIDANGTSNHQNPASPVPTRVEVITTECPTTPVTAIIP
jgi:flagellin-like protein